MKSETYYPFETVKNILSVFFSIAGEPLPDNVLRHKEPGNQSCRMSRDVKSQTFAPYPRPVRAHWLVL